MTETTAGGSHRSAGRPEQQGAAEDLYSKACDRQPQPSPKPIGFRPIPASAIWVASTVRIVTITAGGSYAAAEPSHRVWAACAKGKTHAEPTVEEYTS
jgi:hypothetical protein